MVPAVDSDVGTSSSSISGGGPGLVATAPPAIGGGITPISSIPEPSTWLMLIAGLGVVGTGIRRSRRRYDLVRDRAGALLVPARRTKADALALLASSAIGGVGIAWDYSSPVRASGKVSAVGSKAMGSAALTKLAMCVCPPVAMVVGTIALPPVRHAVYAATAPRPAAGALPFATNADIPCPPDGGGIIPLASVAPAFDTSPVTPFPLGDAGTVLVPSRQAKVPTVADPTPTPAVQPTVAQGV